MKTSKSDEKVEEDSGLQPFLALELKCSLKGITNLRPNDVESFKWHLKLKCTNCGEAPDHWQYVVGNESQKLPGGHGDAQFIEKCKLCSRVNTLAFVDGSNRAYSIEKNEEFQPLITFDCRGIEPYDFDFRDDWIAQGAESGTIFKDIDLSEKLWADYDELENDGVEISELEVRFSHVKLPKK